MAKHCIFGWVGGRQRYSLSADRNPPDDDSGNAILIENIPQFQSEGYRRQVPSIVISNYWDL